MVRFLRGRFVRAVTVLGIGAAMLNGYPSAPAVARPPAPAHHPPVAARATPAAPSPVAPPPTTLAGHGPGSSYTLTGSSAVALTFDDGPDPGNTPAILDLLAQLHVHATFCVIGWRARDNPDLVKRIAAEGHTFCNHSWQHLMDLGNRSPAYIEGDLRATNNVIRGLVPGAQIRYFRAPGGAFTPALVAIAEKLGMAPIYWDVDPRDWDSATFGTGPVMTNHVVAAVENHVRPGSIVLSHDNKRPDTTAAYRVLIPWLQAHGYALIPLPA
jgi:peptidoglycan/xylan/chitin deacetylase (PgdA/CDA1 family)